MKDFHKSENCNENYLAKIVKLSNLRKHSGADRLQCLTIDGNNVITGLEASEGDICVYFPLECTINKEFLSWSNSFEDKTLNVDPNQKGFFNYKGRVRCLKLRGERSEGYIIPLLLLINWLASKDIKLGDLSNIIGVEFDMFNDIQICEKYIPKPVRNGGGTGPRSKEGNSSFIIPGQFSFHSNTAKLAANVEQIRLDDLVSITNKLHGTSFVSSNVLCKRKLNFLERILLFFGIKLQTTEYKNIYSSRTVIKNDTENKIHNHYYGYDLWKEINDKVKHALDEGIILYGEAVGFTNEGKPIQKGYDYGCEPHEFKVYIYKIKKVGPDGKTIIFSWDQVKRFCEKHNLQHVPEFYYGKVSDYLSKWHTHFESNLLLDTLKQQYLEGDCTICKNKVPAEGIVFTIDNGEAYKYKSFRFLERESKELDSGEVDIETEQTVES